MALKILSIIFLSLLLVLSIVFISIITRIMKYINKNTIERAQHYALLNKNAKKNQIVFLGDSLTELYTTSEFFEPLIYNRGISGDDTVGVLNRLSSNVLEIEPSHIFLQIGTNDLGKRKTVTSTYLNIIKIIEEIQINLPYCKLFVISLYPVNSKAFLYAKLMTGPRKNKDILEINRLLEMFCNEQNIPFIDVHPFLTDQDGNLKKEYTIEGLHISFAGYLAITKVLTPYILEESNE